MEPVVVSQRRNPRHPRDDASLSLSSLSLFQRSGRDRDGAVAEHDGPSLHRFSHRYRLLADRTARSVGARRGQRQRGGTSDISGFQHALIGEDGFAKNAASRLFESSFMARDIQEFLMKQNVKIGDVLEVPTPRGFAYVQYAHYQKPYGTLIRVLPGFHQSRPTDFAQLAKTKELYFVFCPIEALVDQGLLQVASHERVPESAARFPPMRRRGFVRPLAKGGGVSNWTIVEDQKEYRVEKLTTAQARLSIASSWNLGMLAQRLTEGWLPEVDLGLPLANQHLSQPQSVGVQHVRHFLYFHTEANARQIRQKLSARGFGIEVRPAAQGTEWLVLLSDRCTTAESLTQTHTELENLAAEFNGQYDGWELEVGSTDGSGDPSQRREHFPD